MVEFLQLSVSVWNTRLCYCWRHDSFSSSNCIFVV